MSKRLLKRLAALVVGVSLGVLGLADAGPAHAGSALRAGTTDVSD